MALKNQADAISGGKIHGTATQARQNNRDPFTVSSADSTIDDPFWEMETAHNLRLNWDELFPFQLLLLEKNQEGRYDENSVKDAFTLPIPPQALSISTPFAITGSVTQGGYIEEHNGAPIREISLSGTTGVLPLRGTVAKASELESGIQTVFAGTVNGIQNVQTAISSGRNMMGIGDAGSININTPQELEDDSEAIKGTGYYQFILLKRFLESYAHRKKNGESKLRLGFAVWKESEVYLVTPVNFRVDRNASSGLEYPYTLQLRAWRRVVITSSGGSPGNYRGSPGVRDPNKFAAVLNSLETARNVLEGARNVLEGIRADIQEVLYTPLRQTMLLAKDVTGTALAVTDFPADIIRDMREPILEMAANVNQFRQLRDKFNASGQKLDREGHKLLEAFIDLAVATTKSDTASAIGIDTKKVVRRPSPAEKALRNPPYSFFSGVNLSSLNLRAETVKKIDAQRKEARGLRRKNFEAYQTQIQRVLADFSDFVGAGAPTYTRIYDLPTRTVTRTPTEADWDVIFALSQTCQAFAALALTEPSSTPQLSTMDYVAGLASKSGIAFTKPASKFAVPFLYGHTLEKMAQIYLGDAKRWHEIATLNGLQSPYVDEIGFSLPLLTNGHGNQILVSDASNLFVNQTVWISSGNVRREKRQNKKITRLAPDQVAVVLDGSGDLSRFVTVANAKIQAFLPNTVNSQQTIFIPSDRAPDRENLGTMEIPGVDYFDPIVRSNGISLLIDSTGDIAMTPWGTSKLAVGMVNAIQKVRLAASVPKGALLDHPDYGFGIVPGSSTADRSAKDLLQDIKNFISSDPGFTGVTSASVRKNANVARIAATIGIKGLGKFLPIEVEVHR